MVNPLDKLGLTYNDLDELQEFRDFYEMRDSGIERYSWPYLASSEKSLEEGMLVSAQDFIEVRYVSSRYVAIDLNPHPRPMDRFHDKLDTTRYFKQADLTFDPLTGLIRFHDKYDIAIDDPRLKNLAGLNDDKKPDLPENMKKVFEKYADRLNGYYIYHNLCEMNMWDGGRSHSREIYTDFLQRVLVADPQIQNVFLDFLLEIEPLFYINETLPPNSYYLNPNQRNYLATLIACGLETSSHPNATAFTEKFYEYVNDVTLTYLQNDLFIIESFFTAGIIDMNRLSEKRVEELNIIWWENQTKKDAEMVFYILAHLFLKETPQGIPKEAFYPEYFHLKKAIDNKDSHAIMFWLTQINDLYLVPKGFAALIEHIDNTNATNQEKERLGSIYLVTPVRVLASQTADENFDIRIPNSTQTYTNHYYTVKNLNSRRYPLYASYYYSKGIDPKKIKGNRSHVRLGDMENYIQKTGRENTFWGIVIFENDVKRLYRYAKFLDECRSGKVLSPFDKWLTDSEFAKEFTPDSYHVPLTVMRNYIFLHEHGHQEAHYHQVSQRHKNNHIYDEIYAELYAMTHFNDFSFMLYKNLDHFLYTDKNQKLHLAQATDKNTGETGFRVQTKHGACTSYYFLQFARDENFWNGSPPLSNDETFVTVYKRSPQEFHNLMIQIRNEINKGIAKMGIAEFQNVTAGKYLQALE